MINEYIQKWLDVIENMANDNTYKPAWGRAILETIGEKQIDGNITINFDELSLKIIKYYWNQTYFFNLKQGSKEPNIAQAVKKMIEQYQAAKDTKIPVWYETAETHFKINEKAYKKQIQKISTILKKDVCWRFMDISGQTSPLYILDTKNRTIFFTKEQATQLKDFRFVLSQLLNYRWAQLLEMFNTAPRISLKLNGISENQLRRNDLSTYKDILLESMDGNPMDFYTGKVLEDNDISVDHVIPWSFMYSDDIWNLVLTSRSNNSSKSNSVPTEDMINRLKERNDELQNYIRDPKQLSELKEAIENNYVDKFYNAIKLS